MAEAAGAGALKTRDQVIEEQRQLHPLIKPSEPKPVITMIMPGRRALGESWSKVTIGESPDGMTIAREDADAPADGKPIMAMSGPDAEYAKYIIEAQMEMAKARACAPQELTAAERYAALNKAWQDYMEQKLRHLKGVSAIGAGGMFQRERLAQNPNR